MNRAIVYVSDLAEMLGTTPGAIRAAVYRHSPRVPPPVRMGRRVAWRQKDVEKWMEKLEIKR